MLLLNNILLTITTFAVLLGTLYPLFTSILDIGKISVGPPYFNYISTFIILPLVFIMTPGILSNWRKTDFSKIYKRSVIYIIFSFILSILILKIFYDTNLLITITALAIAFFTVIGSLIKLSQAIKIKFSQTKSFMKSIFTSFSVISAYSELAKAVKNIQTRSKQLHKNTLTILLKIFMQKCFLVGNHKAVLLGTTRL